jgi:WD40-like Beta Propeller Repeat
MKRPMLNLAISAILLGLGWLVPHSLFSVTLETAPTPAPILAPEPSLVPTLAAIDTPTVPPHPTDIPAPAHDPYGELYFTIVTPKVYYPPAEPPAGIIEETLRLARLPGSCVVGLTECPAAETVETPFNMKDVYMTGGASLVWSRDGRYGLLVTHPEDKLSAGKTKEELEKLRQQSPAEFDISPSTIYLFDAQSNTWQVVYRAESKFIYSPAWSPDGQWIAFLVLSSDWGFHPAQADDGIYVVHPDGSNPHQLNSGSASIQGWIGSSLLLRRVEGLDPALNYTIEMLTLDGEIKPLFESSRKAIYSLAPDGGALLVADAQGESAGLPANAVDVLALDGSVIQTFGTFLNHVSNVYPLAWSRDASLVAFANMRRVYVGVRAAQPALPSGSVGLPDDGSVREVYTADDTHVEPSFWNFKFSSDNKYLLIDVYDGIPHFVAVSLETGQATPVEIKGMESSEQAGFFSWRP